MNKYSKKKCKYGENCKIFYGIDFEKEKTEIKAENCGQFSGGLFAATAKFKDHKDEVNTIRLLSQGQCPILTIILK